MKVNSPYYAMDDDTIRFVSGWPGKKFNRVEWNECATMSQRALEKWAQLQTDARQDRGIVFAGHVGTGKTMATVLMMIALATIRQRQAFVKAGELFQLMQTFDDDSKAAVKALYVVDHLFIDDLGTEYAKDWNLGRFYELIDYRERNQLAVSVTSNKTFAEWQQEEIKWVRIIDRLRGDDLTCEWIEMAGESKR